MLSKQEVIDFVWDNLQDIYNHTEIYSWADFGDNIGLCSGAIRIESSNEGVVGRRTSMQYKSHSHPANTYKDISNFFDKYYDEMLEDDKHIQEIIKDSKYYRKRWSLLMDIHENILINRTPTNTCGEAINIYRQVTGDKIENYNNIIKQNIELIESIDEDLWKIGEFFVDNSPYLVSPIQSITREGDQIYIKAASDLSQEFIENDKLLKLLFTNSDIYVINSNEVDNFISALELIQPSTPRLYNFT